MNERNLSSITIIYSYIVMVLYMIEEYYRLYAIILNDTMPIYDTLRWYHWNCE